MKGLIIKDFLNLKKSLRVFAIISIIYLFFGITNDNPYLFSGLLSIMAAITTISLFGHDDLARWNTYALTLPMGREQIILARYLMMLLLTFIQFVISSIFTIIVNLYLKKDRLFEGFDIIGYYSLIIILVLSIIMPFIIKLGVEKARLIFIVIYIVPYTISIPIKKRIDSGEIVIPDWLKELATIVINNIIIVAPIFVLLVLVVSYFISVSIFKKKEF